MMLYEVSSSAIEALERTTSRHLRKWLRIPPPQFLQRRTVWKEQQASTPTVLTGGGNQDSQDKTRTHPKRLPRCADTRSRHCYPHQQELVGHRDCKQGGGSAQAQLHCRVDCRRT
ncbi:hypothetical protein DPMN_051896 [Dreissena polymorpha]|uniref:Uncharacterized protein n=1 Tax=Dreissena polymorpha TaxID=45954 RepID=A0A9D4HPB4_DREPO|nr:hypothetical protein DPMN_051896 [Dreissena polymorpha]